MSTTSWNCERRPFHLAATAPASRRRGGGGAEGATPGCAARKPDGARARRDDLAAELLAETDDEAAFIVTEQAGVTARGGRGAPARYLRCHHGVEQRQGDRRVREGPAETAREGMTADNASAGTLTHLSAAEIERLRQTAETHRPGHPSAARPEGARRSWLGSGPTPSQQQKGGMQYRWPVECCARAPSIDLYR